MITLAETYRLVAHLAMLDLVRQPREVVYAADPYIAALEAEVERLRSRRCETCSHVLQPHSYSGPYEICWLADSPCYDEVLPDDFVCNRWTAREEAGDEPTA